MKHKNITIQDIAVAANVSKSTVSRVLNNTTPVNEQKRDAVLQAMSQLDYHPSAVARSLAGGQSMTLGVLTQKLGSPFYSLVTQGVIKAMSQTEYSPIFSDGQWDPRLEEAGLKTLVGRQVDGLIMVGGQLDSPTLDLLREHVPMVLAARRLPGWEYRSVAIDNVAAAKMATNYLIQAGHRNIAHIMGIKTHNDAIDRLRGYRSALREANLEVQEALFAQGDFSSQSGLEAMETLLSRSAPLTAVFASNDEMAYGARLALYRHGLRVPEDVSIIGFDNEASSAYTTPPLTTIAQPALEIGLAAAEKLISLINGTSNEIPKLEAELVIRESVARIG